MRLGLVERRLSPTPYALPGRLSETGQQITDWNLAITPGFYYSISGANQPTPVDGGSGTWWVGIVQYHPGPGPRYVQEVREARTAVHATVYRRYWNASTWTPWVPIRPQLMRGTGAQRGAYPSLYWEQWQDTDGAQGLYVGNKAGGWRLFSGTASAATAAWDTTQGTSPAAIVAGRTINFTIPTVLETNEWLIAQSTVVGTGFGFIGVNGITRGPTNTTLTVRFMQIMSLTTQPLSIAWQIVQQ